MGQELQVQDWLKIVIIIWNFEDWKLSVLFRMTKIENWLYYLEFQRLKMVSIIWNFKVCPDALQFAWAINLWAIAAM